jgi:hypothetical protein
MYGHSWANVAYDPTGRQVTRMTATKDEVHMATAQQVINVAESQVGYVEGGGSSGHNGNITKYWAELAPGFQGQPWCAAFVRWVDKHAGAPDLPVSNPYYCPSLVTYARQHGLWDADGRYASGDIVFFDFSGHGLAEHVGRVISDDGKTIQTVEGNTEPSSGGNQANGGGVYRKGRPHGRTVLGVLAYHRLLAASTTPSHGPTPIVHPPRNPVKRNPFTAPTTTIRLGSKGNGTKWVQWAVGVPVDGAFGPQTDHGVRLFQHYHGLTMDGVVGPATRAALAKVTH